MTGFQWLDGSFLEDIELGDGRPPRDLDVVTVYWGYDLAFQAALVSKSPKWLILCWQRPNIHWIIILSMLAIAPR
ncbi:MAG: hypothetical protein O2856_09720 [Planctomycetota bacterium]|nr:hypothetical protein [Planctomycetota bacterium]